MNVDFMHNQIIRDTVSNAFLLSVSENLIPKLTERYGSSLSAVQFYEDHISSGFRVGGEFHYPLTVVVDGIPSIQWIRWQVANYRLYDKFNPFTYKGKEQPLEFFLLDGVSEEMEAAIANKPFYYDGEGMQVNVICEGVEDKAFLSGKYSQGFVDMLTTALTGLIEREFNISGLAESGVVLEVAYAQGTFREHTVGNTTYRRLRIKARGCAARDLWVRWTRLDGNGVYTLSDNPAQDAISFELAEDVSGKIRESEYRYLTAVSVEDYQSAMNRKNITSWREMMRRVIRRGEVTLLDTPEKPEETEEIGVSVFTPTEEVDEVIATVIPAERSTNPFLSYLEQDDEGEDELEESEEEKYLRSVMGITDTPKDEDDSVEEVSYTSYVDEPTFTEEASPVIIEETEEIKPTSDRSDSERELLAELDRMRKQYEESMRQKELETERLRAELEEKRSKERRDLELLSEAAKKASSQYTEISRLEKEKDERERAERERKAEEERVARERAEENARIEREMAERKRMEEAARAAEEKAAAEVRYVSRTVKLLFRFPTDEGITKRIYENMRATIEYYHKEDVYIKIKASRPDSTTVNLDFVQIPENENELLINIVKVLGRSGLGIIKAIVD